MKSRFLMVVLSLVVIFVLAGCATDQLQHIQQQSGTDPTVSNYVERRNIQWKIQVQDRTNTIQWCTFFSNTGSPLTTVAVLNKMTSGNKRLDPSTVPADGFSFQLPNDPALHYTYEVPGADGTFGTSNPYEFGFTPEGIDGYFQTNLMYYCSLKPLTWQTPTINLGTDEALSAKQMEAEKVLQSGGCIDAQLNTVDCKTQQQPAPAPAVPTIQP